MAFVEQRKGDIKFLDWGKLGAYKDGTKHDAEEYVVLPEGNYYLEGILDRIAESAEHLGYIISDAKIYEGNPKDEKGKLIEKISSNVYIKNNASLYFQMIEGNSDDFIPVKEGDKIRFQFLGMYKTKKGGTGYGIKVLVDRN